MPYIKDLVSTCKDSLAPTREDAIITHCILKHGKKCVNRMEQWSALNPTSVY